MMRYMRGSACQVGEAFFFAKFWRNIEVRRYGVRRRHLRPLQSADFDIF